MTPKQIGALLRKAREARGWTWNRTATESGLKADQIKGIEAGNKDYTNKSVVKLAKVFGYELHFLPAKGSEAADTVCGLLNRLNGFDSDMHALTQRLVDVLDAMWMSYTPTNDARCNAARDVLNKAEKAGIRPPDGGVDLDEFDNRPRNRFGIPNDDVL